MCILLLWHPNMSMQYMYINNAYTATKCVNWSSVSDSVMGLLDGTVNSISLYGCYYIYRVAPNKCHVSCKKTVALLPSRRSVHHIAVHKFRTASEEHCGWGYVMHVNQCHGAWSMIVVMYVTIPTDLIDLDNRLNFELAHKNFSWLHGGARKTTELSKLGGGHLHGNGRSNQY